MELQVRSFISPGFGQNAYLVWRDGEASAVAIDPGGLAAAGMAEELSRNGLWLEGILLTHAHIDHIEGVAELVERTGARVWLHSAERPLYDHVTVQASQLGMTVRQPLPPDEELVAGMDLEIAGIRFEVRHVPGHSPGHVILYVQEAAVAFVGDVVFQGSVGRTDLPFGDHRALFRSIREQVLTLPPETTLLPGHGPATTVDHERTTNPFLVPHYGGGFA